jgi:1,2-diacylglycerol 3-beta-galactosyltransferase
MKDGDPSLPKKRMLFMIADTGGGHRASANAIKEALDYLYPEKITIHIIDIWKNFTPWPINRIGDSYVWMADDGQWLWKLIWKTDEKPELVKVYANLVMPPVKRPITRLFEREAPDLVVAFHPLMNHIPYRILKKVKPEAAFATVVTDLVTVHPAWFCPEVDICTIPTVEAQQRAVRYGMPLEKISITGQPVGIKFSKGVGHKLKLREKLGIDSTKPAILLLGGGEGMGHIYEVARTIASRVSSAQLLIIAGKNQALKEKLDAVAWEIPTKIFGFVHNMPELMGASDVIVTKAGPGTISEAFISGLPIILSGYVPGQEEGNVWYVQQHKAGIYEPDPERIASLLENWLSNAETLSHMAASAARLARPDSSLKIAEKLFALVEKEPVIPSR